MMHRSVSWSRTKSYHSTTSQGSRISSSGSCQNHYVRISHLMRTHSREHMKAEMVHSVWKPLRARVEDWPLAVCDGSNVKEDDLLETDHIRRQYNGANMNALYSDKYRWYYLHHQGPEEPLLLKQFDSAANVKTICKLIHKSPISVKASISNRCRLSARILRTPRYPRWCTQARKHRSASACLYFPTKGGQKYEDRIVTFRSGKLHYPIN